MNFVEKIIYSILNLEERFLKKRLEKTLDVKNSSKRKKVFQGGCLLSFDSVAEDEKNKMEEELKLILKQTGYTPEKLLEYIKNQGTPVYYIKFPSMIYNIKENEGFIYPQKGLKALYLSFLTAKKIKFKTGEMFVLSEGVINKFYFIYHLYNWYAYKHGISGIDADSVSMLNRYLFNAADEDIEKLQLADIYKLKDAIKQDKSAIEFVFNLCRELEGSKNAFKKLTEDGTSI